MDYARLFRLDGRVAVVIGAGSGIGRSAARALAAHGADVVCADLNEAGARETAALIGQAGSRAESERDHLRWFCENCGEMLYDSDFQLVDLGNADD